ncbi:MAG: single-stranded DNA-binding protein [Planctomycetota bacterium]|jgi:single-strand DNA-binding protein
MANFNKVILVGNLTRDPDLKYIPSGTAVCEFGIAVNRNFKGKDGDQREEVSYFDIEAWGRQAEVVNQYLSKGRPILIEGRLKQNRWETKEGQKRSKIRVVLEQFQFIGGKGDGGGRQQSVPDEKPAGYDQEDYSMDDSSDEPPF